MPPLHITFWRSGCTPVKANNCALNNNGSSSVFASMSGKSSRPHFTFTVEYIIHKILFQKYNCYNIYNSYLYRQAFSLKFLN